MNLKQHALAHEMLDGLAGLEIGASAHNSFGLQTRNVAPADDYDFYACAHKEMTGEPVARVDIWATADAIPVPPDSEDFVISSHVVEHLPNVIQAFLEWDRIVRVGGFVYMIVPLRNALPADVGRPITPLEHFIEDYRRSVTIETHPLEGVPGGKIGHYHVFTPKSLIAVVRWMNKQGLTDWELVAREDIDTKVGNGFTLAFHVASKRTSSTRAVCKRRWLPSRAERLRGYLQASATAGLALRIMRRARSVVSRRVLGMG